MNEDNKQTIREMNMLQAIKHLMEGRPVTREEIRRDQIDEMLLERKFIQPYDPVKSIRYNIVPSHLTYHKLPIYIHHERSGVCITSP